MAANPGAMPMGGNQMQNGYAPMQNMQSMQGFQPMPGFQGMQAGQPGMNQMQNPGTTIADKMDLIKNIALAGLGVFVLVLGVLFAMKLKDYNELSSDIDGKIALATAEAVDENTNKLEKEFAEREKSPLRSFTGPEDYGSLSFDYPKTWGIYVESDASKGNNYVAYFNPIQVDPLSDKSSIYALRLTITNTSFEKMTETYQKYLTAKGANLTVDPITINGTVANRYTGNIPGTEDFRGYIVLIKIRDKCAILQTDSYLFEADYNKLLESIEFNS